MTKAEVISYAQPQETLRKTLVRSLMNDDTNLKMEFENPTLAEVPEGYLGSGSFCAKASFDVQMPSPLLCARQVH